METILNPQFLAALAIWIMALGLQQMAPAGEHRPLRIVPPRGLRRSEEKSTTLDTSDERIVSPQIGRRATAASRTGR